MELQIGNLPSAQRITEPYTELGGGGRRGRFAGRYKSAPLASWGSSFGVWHGLGDTNFVHKVLVVFCPENFVHYVSSLRLKWCKRTALEQKLIAFSASW